LQFPHDAETPGKAAAATPRESSLLERHFSMYARRDFPAEGVVLNHLLSMYFQTPWWPVI
jgi:hypothetical protein